MRRDGAEREGAWVAGRTRSGRRLRLHLPTGWPSAGALAGAFRRLELLPAVG